MFEVIVVLLVLRLLIRQQIKRNCDHEYEIVNQKINGFTYTKTYECKNCGKKKYIEDWS